MFRIMVSPLQTTDEVEIVEREGIGHPDTICDALGETLSRNLCQEYQRRFGEILHHNVDKAFLCGGRAAAAFGAGSIITPINIYLGRSITEVGNEVIPIKEIAVEGSQDYSHRQHPSALKQAAMFSHGFVRLVERALITCCMGP